MPYSNVISRTDAAALIPEDVSAEVMEMVPEQSAALALFRNTPMARGQQRMPVLAAMPVAYFVNGDTGIKQTTEANWLNKYLNAEELAAIVPIPESVLDDADADIWGMLRPRLAEAIGRALDAAVFFGTNKPGTWPAAIVPAAVAAGNVYTIGTNNAAAGGFAEDVSQTIALVEADGFDPTGMAASRAVRARLRGARSTTGQRQTEIDMTANTIDGIPIRYVLRGLWPAGAGGAEMIVGDWTEGIMGIRQDITYKVLDQAVINDNVGAIIYNLAQQDMVALRVVARFAYQVSNVVNWDQPLEANRFPFAVAQRP